MIEQIVPVKIAEMIRFYGTIVGTPGVSEDIVKMCNKNIKTLLDAIQGNVKLVTAEASGIITK